MLTRFFNELNFIDAFLDYPTKKSNFISFPKEEDPNYTYTKESVEKGDLLVSKESWEGSDGKSRFYRVTSKPIEKSADLLKKEIKKAVEIEDYTLAAKLKKELDSKVQVSK